MQQPPESTASLRATLAMFRRHRWKMALFFSAVMALVTFATLLSSRAYRSQAKLFIRLGRENVTLDPTATFGQAPVVAVPPSRENEINSVVEVLRSRSLLEQVVDRVGCDAILGTADPLPERPVTPREGQTGTADTAREVGVGRTPQTRTPEQDKALRTLTKNLTVEAVKRSNIISIYYDGPSPQTAEAIVAALIELFLDHHASLNRTPGAHRFLGDQTTRARAELLKSEERLRELQAKLGLFSPETQKQIVISRIGRLEEGLLQTTTALASAEAEVKLLTARLAGLPETQETGRIKGVANQGADNMRGQLYTLQLKELELIARHSPQHPEIVLIRQQVSAAKEILAREERAREQVTLGPSRVHEEVRLALFRQEPVVASLKSKAASLENHLKSERGELRTLNDNALRIADLQRVVDLQTSLYRRYSENLAQTQVDRALETEKISNINIVQPATFEVEPVRPRKLLNLAVGLVVALAGSLALAKLADSWDQPQARKPDTDEGDTTEPDREKSAGLVQSRLEPSTPTTPKNDSERCNGLASP